MIYSSNLKHIEPLQWAWKTPLTSTDWITCTIFAVPISKIDMESVLLGQPVASAYPFKVSLGSALHNYLWQWGGPWWTAQHGKHRWTMWFLNRITHGIGVEIDRKPPPSVKMRKSHGFQWWNPVKALYFMGKTRENPMVSYWFPRDFPVTGNPWVSARGSVGHNVTSQSIDIQPKQSGVPVFHVVSWFRLI